MKVISKEDVKYLAGELKKLLDAQDKYRIVKDEYPGNEWYAEGICNELNDEIEYQAEVVCAAFDSMIENKVKEMMNGL